MSVRRPLGTVRTTARVRVRHRAPSVGALVVRGLETGVTVEVVAVLQGDRIHGNDQWFETIDGFIWSGACTALLPTESEGSTATSASAIDWPLDVNRIRRGLNNHTFGMVRHNRDGTPRPHQGWDFSAAVGTPCFAVADGVVEQADGDGEGDYGRQLTLRVEVDGVVRWAFYAHLDRLHVAVGANVACGQILATTGNSGNAYTLDDEDDHLHFELRTVPRPGRGLEGRVSPSEFFGPAPMAAPAKRRVGT